MDGFLGIDIGTTNSKAVLIGENGEVAATWKETTSQIMKKGHLYFDMDSIENFVDSCTERAQTYCKLKSVGFSSVGESVIPIKDGKRIFMPYVWHEKTDQISERQKQIIEQYGRFEHTGVHQSETFSIYKILGMMNQELQEKPDMWLPISSYLIYRKTGIAKWDTSQAGRSYVYDIYRKEWNVEELERLGVKLPLEIGDVGDVCGSDKGIVYGLGGHDHYIGLYAVKQLHGESNLFYDSMGTSSVLAVIKQDKGKKLRGTATYNPKGGCLVTGFETDEYVVNRALDFYGRVLESFASLSGKKSGRNLYDSVNCRLAQLPDVKKLCKIICPKDYSKYAEKAEYINLLELDEKLTFPDLVLSGYLYMVLGTKKLYDDLSRFCENNQKEMPYFTGGGITHNELFMQMKASALGREMKILELSEMSGLGAAFSGMCACGEEKLLQTMRRKLLKGKEIVPQKRYEEYILEMKERYEAY